MVFRILQRQAEFITERINYLFFIFNIFCNLTVSSVQLERPGNAAYLVYSLYYRMIVPQTQPYVDRFRFYFTRSTDCRRCRDLSYGNVKQKCVNKVGS